MICTHDEHIRKQKKIQQSKKVKRKWNNKFGNKRTREKPN